MRQLIQILIWILSVVQWCQSLGKYKHLSRNSENDNKISTENENQDSNNNQDQLNEFGSAGNVSFETLAAALIIGLFALFIVVYTICLQCCWTNRRCPWYLNKNDPKDKYSFCHCVQGLQSPDS